MPYRNTGVLRQRYKFSGFWSLFNDKMDSKKNAVSPLEQSVFIPSRQHKWHVKTLFGYVEGSMLAYAGLEEP